MIIYFTIQFLKEQKNDDKETCPYQNFHFWQAVNHNWFAHKIFEGAKAGSRG